MAFDIFDRPIPGESLTKPLQDDPSTQVPKIDNLYDAFYKITDTVENDSALHGVLMKLIDSGVDLETITNVITFGAFSKGVFSPDIAMQLNPHILLWLFSEAHENGVLEEDIKIMNFPTDTSRGHLTSTDISALMARKNPSKFRSSQREGATGRIDELFSQLKASSGEEVGAPPKEEQDSFMNMQAPEPPSEEMENV